MIDMPVKLTCVPCNLTFTSAVGLSNHVRLCMKEECQAFNCTGVSKQISQQICWIQCSLSFSLLAPHHSGANKLDEICSSFW